MVEINENNNHNFTMEIIRELKEMWLIKYVKSK